MDELGNYLLQMACWLIAFWLVYQLLLRKETYFDLNRWFLVIGLIVSIVAPLFPVKYLVLLESNVVDLVDKSPIITKNTTNAIDNSRPDILLIIYAIGAFISLFLLLQQLIKLKIIRLRGNLMVVEDQKVYQTGKNIVPFSTLGAVYIGNKLNDPSQLKCIVAHEKVHINERHWADLLLLELVRTLQWFNPILIFYRKAMMQNHEYLADRGAIAQGISHKIFQSILVNQMLGQNVIQFASSFNRGNKNKRLQMMNANKSKTIFKLKPLLVLPLIAIILFAFAEPKYLYNTAEETSTMQEGSITVKGKVVNANGTPLTGAAIIIELKNTGTVADNDGNFVLRNVSTNDMLIVSYIGYQNIKKKAKEKMEFTMERNIIAIADDKKENLPPPPPPPTKQKEKLTIVDDDPNKKDLPPPPPPKLSVQINSIKKQENPLLIVVDGKIYHENIDDINPTEIESITVLRDKVATDNWGDRGKNGVVEIKLKKENNEVFTVVEEMPQFPGGSEKLIEFINNKTKEVAEKGETYIQFTISEKGKVENVKVAKSSGNKNLDKKAIEIVESLPDWTPGKQRGKPVTVDYTIPVKF